ncbi:MAG: universal stress protein [Specibacter sp.]
MEEPNTAASSESRIVVGVDGSPESVLALRWAAALAPTLGAQITAVTAWHFETVVGPYAATEWDPEADATDALTDALAEAFGDEPPKGLRSQCRRGNPAQVLIDAGRTARMIIVGSRGHGGFAGLLLGSVSQACVEHATCAVLVVHRGTSAPVAAAAAPGQETGEPVHNR